MDQPSALVDLAAPVEWTHPLARGLVAWFLAVPGVIGGRTWLNLCRPRQSGTLTNVSLPALPTSGWQPTRRLGGYGELYFDGLDDHVSVPGHGLHNLGPLTLTAWARPVTMGENVTGYILAKQTGLGVNGWAFHLFQATGPIDTLRFEVDYLTQNLTVRTGGVIVSGVNAPWQHYAVTWTGSALGSGVRLYLNGAPQATGATIEPLGGRVDDTVSGLTLGNEPTLGRTFRGPLDDLRIYNRVLTPAEMKALYQHSQQGYAGLLRRVRSVVLAAGLPVVVTPLAATLGLRHGEPSVVVPTRRRTRLTGLGVPGRVPVQALAESQSVTPQAAALALAGVDPGVSLGSLPLTPSVTALGLASVPPGVLLGSVAVSALASPLFLETAAPQALLGSVSVTPSVVPLGLTSVPPSLVLGSVSVTPAAATVQLHTTTPLVQEGGLTLTVPASILGLSTAAPSVLLGSLTASPSPSVLDLDDRGTHDPGWANARDARRGPGGLRHSGTERESGRTHVCACPAGPRAGNAGAECAHQRSGTHASAGPAPSGHGGADAGLEQPECHAEPWAAGARDHDTGRGAGGPCPPGDLVADLSCGAAACAGVCGRRGVCRQRLRWIGNSLKCLKGNIMGWTNRGAFLAFNQFFSRRCSPDTVLCGAVHRSGDTGRGHQYPLTNHADSCRQWL